MDLRLCDFLRVQAPHIFARHQVEDDGPYHGSRSATGRRRSRVNQDTRTHIPDPYHIDDRSGSIDDTGSGVDHPTSKSSPQRRSGRRDNSLPRAASSRRIEEKQLWTGKLARNGKKQVDTVAVPLMGNLDVVLSGGTDVVNITHRLKWEDAEKTSHIAVFYFKAQRVENTEDFRDYITYFQEKQRIGVATMGNGISIYVCAPGAPLYNQYAKEVNEQGPLLIAMAIDPKNANTGDQSNKPDREGRLTKNRVYIHTLERSDWLKQLNSITAMLGNN